MNEKENVSVFCAPCAAEDCDMPATADPAMRRGVVASLLLARSMALATNLLAQHALIEIAGDLCAEGPFRNSTANEYRMPGLVS